MEKLELRLLRCFLGGPRDSGAEHPAEVCGEKTVSLRADERDGNGAGSLEDGIRDIVCEIECGFYSRALASRCWSVLLGDLPTFEPLVGRKRNASKEFYDFLESRIYTFLGLDPGGGSAGHIEEDERQEREVLVLALGVAVLCIFLQANLTGPIQEQFPLFPLTAALTLDKPSADFGTEWEDWARDQLMVDGCDIMGKISLPQYLILAKLLLVSPAENMVKRPEADSGGPRTRSWWAFRVLLIQQRVLAERSASLRSLLVASSLNMIKYFGTSQAVDQLTWELDPLEANSIAAAAHLEVGLMEHIYGHDDSARGNFDKAAKSCGLELSVTGILGYRTQYQSDPKAQMVLVATSQSSTENDTNWLDFVDSADENPQNAAANTTESEILLTPKLVHATTDAANSVEDDKRTGGDQKILTSIEQAIVLAMGVDVKKSNADDELRSWQMAPYIEAIDIQRRSQPMVKSWSQLLRIRWEKTRPRTRERSFLMMEQLANDIREGSVKVSQRMPYVLCVPFPILPALLKEYAELMVGFGLIGDAMKLFEELELWNNLIDCYCLLGKKTAAAGLIRQRLEVRPDEPRLWCSLGDVTLDEDCYHKAWEVSGHRFTRAQRSLARAAYNKGNYSQAVKHWDLALSLNPLHPDGWFALGSAALKTRDVDKALLAFTRQVQLDPENGESWNNIAAINMQKKRNKEAFVAFGEALKLKRNSWQIWENFGTVALNIGNLGQAILAVEKVYDLSEEKRVDVTALGRLVEELEVRKGLIIRPAEVPTLETNESLEKEGFEHDGSEDDSDSWSSMVTALPTLTTTKVGEDLSCIKDTNSLSLEKTDSAPSQSRETEMLVEKVGKLLSRIVAKGIGGGEVWGLKARWHRLVGDMSMYIEALLKQVRAYQGSKWQSSPEQFEVFASACLQLAKAYMDSGSAVSGKRELSSAQMLLRSTIKQAEHFKSNRLYNDLVSCLQVVETKIKAM
ncbi:unnamed protein product [Calypogeia fissa]